MRVLNDALTGRGVRSQVLQKYALQKWSPLHSKTAQATVQRVALVAALVCAFSIFAPSVANAQETWVVGPNASLRSQLEDWATRAGWTLIWEEPAYDVILKSGVALSGSFEEAITSLMESSPVVTATTYRGNKTVVITVKGSFEQ
jgi:hypothetical protein